ncbi:MAG: hypothetical protein ACE5D0_00930 [Fidelibacterota bacterium]
MSIHFLNNPDRWFWSLIFTAILVIIWIYLAVKKNRNLSVIYLFRIFALIIVLFLLLQPKITWEENIQHPMHWNVYVDKSVSMAYHQSLSPKLYLNEIQNYIGSVREIDRDAQIFTFDQTIQDYNGQPIEMNGAVTDISNVFTHISETQEDLIGAIIISDGQITKGNIDQNQLERIKTTIYTIGVGDTIPMVDIAIQSISAPTIAIKGEEMDIDATIITQGIMNERINVLLYNESKLIGSKYFQLSGDGSLSKARFRVSSGALGVNKYLIKATVLKDEINISNNQLPFEVVILKDRYNVALITGAPNFNTGPIKKSINAFPRASLDHYIQIGNSFNPSISEFWSKQYELIILENFPLNPVSKRWQKIFAKKLISNKSSLFYIAGPNITPKAAESLYPFLHVKASNSTPKEIEKRNWYWADNINDDIFDFYSFDPSNHDESSLPPLTPKLIIESNENTTTLALFEKIFTPTLVIGDNDGLRSAIWTSSDFSRLYYKLTESESADYSINLMGNMYGWLLRTSGEDKLYFRLNKNVFQQGEEIYVSGTHAGFNEDDIGQTVGYIKLVKDQKVVRSYELNYNPSDKLWEKRFIAGKAGDYSYTIQMDILENSFQQKGHFVIDESQIELNNVSVNSLYLTSISYQTNGKYMPWESRAEILKDITDNVKNEMVLETATFHENYITIMIIIILLSIEWYIRRFIGLT